MQYLKKILGYIFSKQMLAFIAFVLIAVAIWYVGPLLGFSGLYPLESVEVRVIVIVLLLATALFWLLKLPASILFVVSLCLLIWHAGPLVVFGGAKPFEEAWVRASVIAVIFAVYMIYAVWRLLLALKANDQLLNKILSPASSRKEIIARNEIKEVSTVVGKAVQRLKRMRTSAKGLGRFFEGKRYIYELPWYMVIGSPGAGKTTAILSSGLKFPLAEQLGSVALKGHGGTANCDWWFTNEAVLIDTAGRYTEQNEQSNDQAAINAAEWQGFLGQLVKYRPRAPINGALLTISVADLLTRTESERVAMAAEMRARLSELRNSLGIRFPVYVVVTKLDLLPGFAEYFQSLSAETRAQVWGFTLPYQAETIGNDSGLFDLFVKEFSLLELRLERGLITRLQEEYENDRRKAMYTFPQDFRRLTSLLSEMLQQVFLDSRYDNTQVYTTLRGVYLTSAAQISESLVVDHNTLYQRLKRTIERSKLEESDETTDSKLAKALSVNRSFFLQSLFEKIVIPEAHLVRPNLRWEMRFKLLKIASHTLAIVLFLWLASSMSDSFEKNSSYLTAMNAKVANFSAQVNNFRKSPNDAAVPVVLRMARNLPNYSDLNLNDPDVSYRYGLYAAPSIVEASSQLYAYLLRQLLLPQVLRYTESALNQAIQDKNPDAVYEILQTYLMFYDAEHFKSDQVKSWVLRDWERSDRVLAFGGRVELEPHLKTLFSEDNWAIPDIRKNDSLIQSARLFLESNPSSKRLYERARVAMESEAPDNMTLNTIIGSSAGTILTVADSEMLSAGIPGLYTYEGFHNVFEKRLPEFIGQAQTEDSWVMGRRDIALKLGGLVARKAVEKDTIDAVRAEYLKDYANYWEQFLEGVRTVSGSNEQTGGTLALEIQTLRALASPDSPLARLAKVAVRETSLTVVAAEDPNSLGKQATAEVERKSRAAKTISAVGKTLTSRSAKQVKEYVDNRFSALREVVTGQADTNTGPALSNSAASVMGKSLQLDSIIGLLNEQYTLLVLAENALSSNSMPATMDIGAKLKVESAKLPAPFRAVLSSLADRANVKVSQSVGSLLSSQLEGSVGNTCRQAIEGKYPFAKSDQEVNIEDFIRVFSAGGILDDFFQKTLAVHVDTNANPWRYKYAESANSSFSGPSLVAFQQAAAIREVFFRESGSKRMAWKMNMKVAAMDPEITQLNIDIDGQSIRYAHGPVTVTAITWPGPRGGAAAEIFAAPKVRPESSSILTSGPWALFRLLEKGRIIDTASSGRVAVDFVFDGRRASLDINTGNLPNPLTSTLLRDFHCPTGRLL
ncbi:type VI secretion system membrane subunit TssM [Neisseriaceae bacterium TC5R-5]|nr:type VI secretion system membrane subunit TssM [Neisseriaceae bacterium TC5R-5]